VQTQGSIDNTTSLQVLTAAQAAPTTGGVDSTALGVAANASSTGATAFGAWSHVIGANGTAVGFRSVASTGSVALGYQDQASGTESVAIGYGNVIAGSNSGAFGDPNTVTGGVSGSYAFGNNNTISSNNAFILGNGDTIGPGNDGAVVLGVNSTPSGPNTVSVGSPGNERRITNVAPGVNPTDAVNMSQLSALTQSIAAMQRTAYSGVAMSMAMAGTYMPSLNNGQSSLGLGLGYFQGYKAVGIAFRHLDSGGVMSFGAGISASHGYTGANFGVSWKW
jgi:autotransporter adhesin